MSNQPHPDDSASAYDDERDALRERIEALEARYAELYAFVEAAAHDLKAPMQIIMGYAIMLNQMIGDQQGEDVRAGLKYIESHTYQANEIVESLLLLADVAGADDARELVDARLAAEAAAEDLEESVQECCAAVVIEPDLPPVMGNPVWLEGVFRSLIGAALRYADADAPHIAVDAEPRPDAVCYRFRGGRAGVEAADGGDLFDAYTRAGPGNGVGTGISLAIARRIVDHLGGRIGAEREPGGGVVFWVELPGAES
jgi:light-regulated signal transduction histidine kinase (bacteriophytochrome)